MGQAAAGQGSKYAPTSPGSLKKGCQQHRSIGGAAAKRSVLCSSAHPTSVHGSTRSEEGLLIVCPVVFSQRVLYRPIFPLSKKFQGSHDNRAFPPFLPTNRLPCRPISASTVSTVASTDCTITFWISRIAKGLAKERDTTGAQQSGGGCGRTAS